MKKLLVLIFSFFISGQVLSAPTNSISLTTPTDNTVVSASDETTRYNEISTKFGTHDHQDFTLTTSNTFTIGDNAAGNKDFIINDDSGNSPTIRFNTTSDLWTISNNGSTFSTHDLTSSTVNLAGNQTITGDKTFSAATTTTFESGSLITFESGSLISGTVKISSLTIGGSDTPVITMGDADEEDTQINFDGNVKDYHIGLQDATDDLTIGLGTTLGTTTHMNFTADGEITKPLQPTFSVQPSTSQTNIAIGSDITVIFGTEIFDIGSNFAANTFTAPVTGKYILTYALRMSQLDDAADNILTTLITSNRSYVSNVYDFGLMSGDPAFWASTFSIVADMDANDTAIVAFNQASGTQQVDIGTDSYFSGALIN